jgi:hypothetical protein
LPQRRNGSDAAAISRLNEDEPQNRPARPSFAIAENPHNPGLKTHSRSPSFLAIASLGSGLRSIAPL